MRRRPVVDDTQPVPPASGSSLAAHRPSARPRRGRGCTSCLVRAIALLLLLGGALALGGTAFRYWLAAQPRLTLLVLGLDRRPDEGYAVRSDTIILATFRPADARVGLLSVPRDLYVDIPGHGANRINSAHLWGETEAPGRGPALAVETVMRSFGVPVQRYVRLDFEAFRAVVDALGGVDVFVEEPIADDEYPTDEYGTVRIEIPAGWQHLDGETALRYVRCRHNSSDFDRAERQQQVLIALARRFAEPRTWPRVPGLYRVVMNRVDTDLTARDAMVLASVVLRGGPDEIDRRAVDREMTQPWTTPDGAAVLLPRWEVISPLTREMFAP